MVWTGVDDGVAADLWSWAWGAYGSWAADVLATFATILGNMNVFMTTTVEKVVSTTVEDPCGTRFANFRFLVCSSRRGRVMRDGGAVDGCG